MDDFRRRVGIGSHVDVSLFRFVIAAMDDSVFDGQFPVGLLRHAVRSGNTHR